MSSETVVVFDLDDTLFPEVEYVLSAYKAIARRHGLDLLGPMMAAGSPAEAFDSTGLPIGEVLEIYRTHRPDIRLPWSSLYTLALLHNAGYRLGLVTDGRSITQRHKIEALGLERFIEPQMMFVSEEVGEEKTGGKAFRHIMDMNPGARYIYVGDNPAKDIDTPLSLGWLPVILLDAGRNIHPQNLNVSQGAVVVRCLTELPAIVAAQRSAIISE